MLNLILYILIVFSSKSNEIPNEKFVVFPNFEIDSNYNDDFYRIILNIKEDDLFESLDVTINDIDQNKLAELSDFELSDIQLPFTINKKNVLVLIQYKTVFTDTIDNSKNFGYGYRYFSNQNRIQRIGKTLILVDFKIQNEIKQELNDYIHTLEKSGIKCDLRRTQRAEEFDAKKVQQTMAIVQEYHKDNPDLENIIIIGRVPFAMSGHYTPDGHRTESYGAWPTDLFYAINSKTLWQDSSIDTTPPPDAFPWHHNIKADGKFDPGYLPNDVEINIGRIDMYNLPAFEESEAQLIKRYFQKNKNFRTGTITPENNAILDDGWGNTYREKFSTEAIINYNAIFGENNYQKMKSRTIMDKESYLFFWGGASGGTNSIFDIVYTDEISNQNFNAVFNTVFGSRAVEWSVEDNIMRAIIASEPMALTARWGVRPFFYNFPMGVGKTIGYCHTFSANNTYLLSHGTPVFHRTIHQTLIGDPTLKMYYPAQINFKSITKLNDEITFEWDKQDNAVGYNIYFKDDNLKHYELLNEEWIRENTFISNKKFKGKISFLLKKVEKIQNNQGSYFEESIGSEWIVEN